MRYSVKCTRQVSHNESTTVEVSGDLVHDRDRSRHVRVIEETLDPVQAVRVPQISHESMKTEVGKR